jgi:hypothetical protein
MSLCDYQTILENIDADMLPGKLPEGYSLVMGLDLSILRENQAVETLPEGTGVQMDFPVLDNSKDQLTVLYWNGSAWIEISQQAGDENTANNFYQIVTTDKTGIFVLAKK